MSLDFSSNNGEIVGYKIKRDSGKDYIEPVKFEDFIPSYAKDAGSYGVVYDNLRKDLRQKVKEQDNAIREDSTICLETLASLTLEREAIMNSIKILIEEYGIECVDDSCGGLALW